MTESEHHDAPSLEEQQLSDYLTILELPKAVHKHFNAQYISDQIDMESATTEEKNTWALSKVGQYEEMQDGAPILEDMLIFFKEDFEGWKPDDFAALPRELRHKLRQLLNSRGIYLGKANAKVNHLLADLLTRDDLPEWDDPEYRKARHEFPDVKTWRVMEAISQPAQPVRAAPPQPKISIPPSNTQPSGADTPDSNTSRAGTPATQGQATQGQAAQDQDAQQQPDQKRTQPRRSTFYRIPPIQVPNEMCPATVVAAFVKIWPRESNYTGEAYDILDDKFRRFLTTCNTVGIRETQFHAVFPSILSGDAQDYYVYSTNPELTFTEVYNNMKLHFDTEVNKAQYHTDWSSLTFHSVKISTEAIGKSNQQVLQILLKKMRLCQRALGPGYMEEHVLIHAVMRACRGVPELEFALFTPATTFEELASKLRSSIATYENRKANGQFPIDSDTYYTDRRYQRRDRGDKYGQGRPRGQRPSPWKKKCWICNKDNCRSYKHSDEEQRNAKQKWRDHRQFQGQSKQGYTAFLLKYEGDSEVDDSSENDQDDTRSEDGDSTQYSTAAYLSDNSVRHRLTAQPEQGQEKTEAEHFILDRYSNATFQGIIADTGAAKVSTAGKGQYIALQREIPSITLDDTRAGEASIRFGGGPRLESLGSTDIDTPFGKTTFHVMDTSTPFLLSLKDMDRLGIYLHNLSNKLIREEDGKQVNVIRKWGHAFFFPQKDLQMATGIFLTEAELRRVHTRFGHPSVPKLYKLLTKAGHEVEQDALAMINKFCHYCQVKGSTPRRFKFTLKKDVDFNFEIIVDVMYLDGDPVLHVVDAATSFQAARFLSNLSAKETWEALKMCWIDTYLGPPDVITHDAGTNFDSSEFRAEAKLLGITCHQVPVEAHWSIGKVEEYHGPLRRAFDIVTAETKGTISRSACLQMALKAVNDTAGPDGLVPTLLVFGAYPRIVMDSPPSASQQQRAKAINKAMSELRKTKSQRSIRDALNTRNGPDTLRTLPQLLALGSEVLVFREKGGWSGPFKVLSTSDKDVTIDTDNGTVIFRSTHVKPYLRYPGTTPASSGNTSIDTKQNKQQDIPQLQDEQQDIPQPFEYPEPNRPRRRGRPPKEKPANLPIEKRPRGRPRKNATAQTSCVEDSTIFITQKERQDLELAIQLRAEGKIRTPGKPFEQADVTELNSLFEAGVLKVIKFDPKVHGNIRIFKSRLVREVKGKTTQPYEKSRLVVQGYHDEDKEALLTTSPTIQRCSQRVIMALAPSFRSLGMVLMLRDITQAYTQSKTKLNRLVLVQLPAELKKKYPEGTLLHVVLPLYGLAEAGMHWFATYFEHHKEQLGMETSAFDPCLLITKDNQEEFGITGLQTDDTLNLGTVKFMEKEDSKLQKAKLKAKPQTILGTGSSGDFNGCHVEVEEHGVTVTQKGQANKLSLVDAKQDDAKQRYVVQRARGAYIASICQPEAAFDLSAAAQATDPNEADIKALNKRIQWQIDNKSRGLRFQELDLETAKLFVFVDGSFANNQDMTSQIGYILVLGNEAQGEAEFTLTGNTIHWSSTKCKRVTRSVLASEIYGMVSGFDIGYVIANTLATITKRLNLPRIPLILCTDSFSLYQCIVQLGTTTEKRLMIDIIALRQSYENREVDEIRWIHGQDNPADAMTKAMPNRALENLISDNATTIRLEGWVQRKREAIVNEKRG